jgi:hypothetical protein
MGFDSAVAGQLRLLHTPSRTTLTMPLLLATASAAAATDGSMDRVRVAKVSSDAAWQGADGNEHWTTYVSLTNEKGTTARW